jgi:hypothetical protein
VQRASVGKRIAAGEKARRLLGEAQRAAPIEDFPDSILAAVRQTEAKTAPGKLPVTILRKPGAPAGDALVVVKFSSWLLHFGEQFRASAPAEDSEEAADG